MQTRTETSRSKRWWIGWSVAAVATISVLGLVVAPPFVGEVFRQVIMAGFSGVCHQIPGRSPHIAGVQLAVCDRCLGIYGALAAAALLYPTIGVVAASVRKRARLLVPIAVLAPGIDWAGDVLGWWVNTPATRLATGAVFGGVAGILLAGAFIDLIVGSSVDETASVPPVFPSDGDVERRSPDGRI